MHLLRQLHLYLGLCLSLLLFVSAVTGAALVYKDAYWRWSYSDSLPSPAPTLATELSAAEQSAAIAQAVELFGADLRSVKLPQSGWPVYQLYLESGHAFMQPGNHQLLDQWQSPSDRLMALLFDLHAHLMMGHRGELLVGSVGLAGVLMLITGLILWWPNRRHFRPRNLLPRGSNRGLLILWHRDLGALAAPLLLLILLSGASLVFYASAQKLLNGLMGDPVPEYTTPEPRSGEPQLPDARALKKVVSSFDRARLVFYYPPEAGNTLQRFRLKQACEWHPNGRSYAYWDSHSRAVVATQDACAAPPGERALNSLYPLHSGKMPSASYNFATFIAALALAVLTLTGVLAYIGKLRKIHRRKSKLNT